MEIITAIIAGAMLGLAIGTGAAIIAHKWRMWRNDVARRKTRFEC